ESVLAPPGCRVLRCTLIFRSPARPVRTSTQARTTGTGSTPTDCVGWDGPTSMTVTPMSTRMTVIDVGPSHPTQAVGVDPVPVVRDRKSTRLISHHVIISYHAL